MNGFKRFLSFIFRVDIFNRIIVAISMIIFLIEPSIVLYFSGNYDNNLNDILPSLVLLVVIVGTGSFTIYRPIKSTWLYFLQILFTLCLFSNNFLNITLYANINKVGLFITELIYCSIGFIINIITLARTAHRYNKNKILFNEYTNRDAIYDFLSATDKNAKIEEQLEQLDSQNLFKLYIPIKKLKLSRTLRFISLIIYEIVSIYYLIRIKSVGAEADIIIYPLVSGMVMLPIIMLMSVFFPRDFKYIFFYNIIVYSLFTIFCCRSANVSIIIMLISLVASTLAFFATLIVEGRTWTGSPIDKNDNN